MSAYDDLILSRAPLLYWPLDNLTIGVEARTAVDVSGNGRNGSAWAPTNGAGALSLVQGAGSSFEAAANQRGFSRAGAGLGPSGSGHTIECWVAFTPAAITAMSASPYPFLISVGAAGAENTSGVYYIRDSRQFVYRCGHYSNRDAPAAAIPSHPTGRSLHVVATQSADGTTGLWINNVKVAGITSTGWTAYPPATTLEVCCIGNATDRSFGGAISHVAVYGRALTSTEIGEHYSEGVRRVQGVAFNDAPFDRVFAVDADTLQLIGQTAPDAAGNYRIPVPPAVRRAIVVAEQTDLQPQAHGPVVV